jgi:hypothetical protein
LETLGVGNRQMAKNIMFFCGRFMPGFGPFVFCCGGNDYEVFLRCVTERIVERIVMGVVPE